MGRILSVVIALGVAVHAVPRDIIDLGYAVHQATIKTIDGDFYTFQNIRFAEPPVGLRRFKPPVAITTINRTINDGSVGFVCTQGWPTWQLKKIAKKKKMWTWRLNQAVWEDESQSEDCLFLDVYVPGVVLEDRLTTDRRAAPVIIRIPDGSFVNGQKTFSGPTSFGGSLHAAGLIDRSAENGSRGIIFVHISYRLGMYGWLNPGDDPDISPNVGLQDQRMAMEWVKRHIHKFGGDPDNITVMGSSAGAASIMHHITAKGGRAKVPFHRAIIQSPKFETVVDAKGVWADVLSLASYVARRYVRNGAELAALNATVLCEVNHRLIRDAKRGSFMFGPTIDGDYVPDLPGVLLLKGQFDPGPSLLIGHTSSEWLDAWDPDGSDGSVVDKVLRGVPDEKLAVVWSDLYPPPSDTTPYTTLADRAKLVMAEFSVICNTRYLSNAFGNRTWDYRFQVPPAFHGLDVFYALYNGGGSVDGVKMDEWLAGDMQRYLTNFAQFGSPNADGLLKWREHGGNKSMATFGIEGLGAEEYEANNKRCAYWQTGKYRTMAKWYKSRKMPNLEFIAWTERILNFLVGLLPK